MDNSSEQTLISLQINDGRLQTINLLATANNYSRSRQIRRLIDKVNKREIDNSHEIIADKAYEKWDQLSISKIQSWDQFKKSVNNWLHGKQIGQKNIKAVLKKLQERHEENYDN